VDTVKKHQIFEKVYSNTKNIFQILL